MEALKPVAGMPPRSLGITLTCPSILHLYGWIVPFLYECCGSVKVSRDIGLTIATGSFGGSAASIPLCPTLFCLFGNGVATHWLENRFLHFVHL